MSALARFDELLGRAVSMRALALLRLLAGPIVLLHLQPFLADASDGETYRDAFYEPYADWYPELPEGLHRAALASAVAAVAMSLGLLTRVATAATFAIVTYNVFLSTTIHNNRAYLIIVLGLLAVAPCGRELSLDAWIRRRRGRPSLDTRAPGWPLWLLRFECAAIYGASGLSKLWIPTGSAGRSRGSGWSGPGTTSRRGRPDWAISVLTDEGFHVAAAKFIVLTELFIALGLWWRARATPPSGLVVFHLSIETSASVQVFSLLGIAVLLVWAVPSTRDRVLRLDPDRHRRLAAAVGALDWLGALPRRAGSARSEPEVIDRDGTVIRGRPAVAFAFSRLPLTAWFALPALLLPSVRRARRAGREMMPVPVAANEQ